MRRRLPSPHRSRSISPSEDFPAVEVLVWIFAWFVLPLRLAMSDAATQTFFCYALGSGLILAAGTLLNAWRINTDLQFAGWFLCVCTASVVCLGGSVFVAARLLT